MCGKRYPSTPGGAAVFRGLAVILASALPGCETAEYILHVGSGQLGLQNGVEPIDEVLADGRLTPEQESKLRLIVEIRQFGIDRLALHAGQSYTTFYDTGGDPLAFNLSAARKEALVPRSWQFPWVGSVPYLGFFDLDFALRVKDALDINNYDTFLYEVDAYSTLGLFADPVRSPMLNRSDSSLADTILHELLHNTVWRVEDVEFNESLASFVGRTGALEFLIDKFGPNSETVSDATARYADLSTINIFLLELFADLDAYYAQPIDADQKIAGREAVYQAGRDRFADEVLPQLSDPVLYEPLANLPANNAWLLGNYRYNLDLGLFEAVFVANQRSWSDTLAVFRQAAAATADAKEFLRQWLLDRNIIPPDSAATRTRAVRPPAIERFGVLTLRFPARTFASNRSGRSAIAELFQADESCRVRRRAPAPAGQPN